MRQREVCVRNASNTVSLDAGATCRDVKNAAGAWAWSVSERSKVTDLCEILKHTQPRRGRLRITDEAQVDFGVGGEENIDNCVAPRLSKSRRIR
jgi:hypothetical protein